VASEPPVLGLGPAAGPCPRGRFVCGDSDEDEVVPEVIAHPARLGAVPALVMKPEFPAEVVSDA
jgi:hypothetical protein